MSNAIPLEQPAFKGPLIVGAVIIGVFFFAFIGWASLAPLSSAAVATGTVVIDGKSKTVQHLDGGIVDSIAVSEGASVEAGQVLVRLDDTQARASMELLRGRWIVAHAIEARLKAERRGLAAISFPEDLLERTGDAKVVEILAGQENTFKARQDNFANQTAILEKRIAQYREEIKGIEGQIDAETKQLALLDEQIEDMQALFDKGWARKPRLLQLKDRAAAVEGNRSLHRAQISRARQSISESRLRVTELGTSRMKEIAEQVRSVQAEIYDLDERIRAAEDVLARTVIRSPATGTVVGLQVHTAGGVIRAGDALMGVVPSRRTLIIEARVEPADIDVVQPGLTAKVRLTAFNQRNRQPVDGRVTSISADRFTDPKTGRDFYMARVELNGDSLRQLKGAPLYPGMQAEVMIVTGSRTALGYFLEPLLNSLNRAFRES
jgi:HlyD family type I secretion membrane fusion protein